MMPLCSRYITVLLYVPPLVMAPSAALLGIQILQILKDISWASSTTHSHDPFCHLLTVPTLFPHAIPVLIVTVQALQHRWSAVLQHFLAWGLTMSAKLPLFWFCNRGGCLVETAAEKCAPFWYFVGVLWWLPRWEVN